MVVRMSDGREHRIFTIEMKSLGVEILGSICNGNQRVLCQDVALGQSNYTYLDDKV